MAYRFVPSTGASLVLVGSAIDMRNPDPVDNLWYLYFLTPEGLPVIYCVRVVSYRFLPREWRPFARNDQMEREGMWL